VADNVELNAGSGGATLATDDVAGVHYQVVKLAVGADGAASLVANANPIPVSDAGGSVTVDAPVGTPVFVRLSDGTDPIATLPVSLASVPSHAVTNAGTFAVQAAQSGTWNVGTVTAVTAISNALPAGTNNIGDVDILSIAAGDNNIGNVDIASIAAGDNNIGNVDVVSLPALAAGTNNIGDVDVLTVPTDPFGANADAASATGSISAKLRFIASTGIPITGTVTVGSHAVTNAGTFVTQENGAALTALQLLDDCVITDHGTFTPATTKVTMCGFTADEASTDSVDEGDGGAARMTLDRKVITTTYAHAAAGGATPYKNLDCDETEDDIKTSAGKLFWIHVMNLANAVRYIKFYNATAANTTVGTTTPVLSFPVPTMADTNGAGFCVNFGDMGVQFDTAICVAATTGLADNNTGAPGTNEVVLNAGYL